MELVERPAVSLQIENLCKSFGPKPVLSDLNLNVRPGEFVAIVGKSGCGKSTLLRLIAGLDSPSSGLLRVNGQTAQAAQPHTRMMFQDARLLPWKRVLANIGLGLSRQERPRAERLLEQVGLYDRANDWPAVLSGGQRQRVALARALVSEPALLLLDEPLGALDALTRLEMQRLIEELWQLHPCTALLITHDVEEAVALADRVVVIEEGRIALDLPIELPRPRLRTTPEFTYLKEVVLEQVMGREYSRQLGYSEPPNLVH